LAYAALLKGDLDRAQQEAEQAIRLDPKLGSGFINLGLVLAKRGEYVKAKLAFQRALDLDPEDPRAKDNLRELEEQAKQKPH
jgi:Flp pilus assembly protein TadD